MKTMKLDIDALFSQLPDATKPGRESRLEGPSPELAEKIARAILAGRRESLLEVVGRVRDESGGDGESYRAGLAVHLVALHVSGEKQSDARRLFCDAVASRLGGEDTPTGVKRFLIRELQVAGDESVVPQLGALLGDEELSEPAVQALVAIGNASASVLRAALETASGSRRVSIIQALGVLRDPDAASKVGEVLGTDDPVARLAAASAIANIAPDGPIIESVLRVADQAVGWERIQATKACLVFAERLAKKGKGDASRKIYTHLRDTRTKPADRYIREIAERALEA
jgi:hypothetical protein